MSLEVSIKPYKKFELPSEGVQAAVLADVVDLGLVDTKYGKKEKVRFVFLLAEVDSEGRQKRVFTKYTNSLNEKAGLRKALVQMGQKFDASVTSVKLESYIGKQVSLVISYSDGKEEGEKYANVLSIMKPAARQSVEIPADFKRAKDKDNA